MQYAASPVQYVAGGTATQYATSPSVQYVAAAPVSPSMQYVQPTTYAEDLYAQPYGYTTTAGYGYPGKFISNGEEGNARVVA